MKGRYDIRVAWDITWQTAILILVAFAIIGYLVFGWVGAVLCVLFITRDIWFPPLWKWLRT